jgi:multisubunit Na+/H+ antiporter MnhG subunit
MTATTNTLTFGATEYTEEDIADTLRVCMRVVLITAVAVAAYAVLSLFLWAWLAAVLALATGLYSEAVAHVLGRAQYDAAAQAGARGVLRATSWLRSKLTKSDAPAITE